MCCLYVLVIKFMCCLHRLCAGYNRSLPELPKGHDHIAGNNLEIKQLWNSKGESCPNGTIPIRRTSASDIISISKFGKKYSRKDIPGKSSHEHAIGYVDEGEFYGAKALLNIWKPTVIGNDFSLSQIWVLSNIQGHLANSIEAGWHVSSSLALSLIYLFICNSFFLLYSKIHFYIEFVYLYQNVTINTISILIYMFTLFHQFVFKLYDWISK
ncbi:putative neprosin [Helianthus debilis subsp. tardiflorus]